MELEQRYIFTSGKGIEELIKNAKIIRYVRNGFMNQIVELEDTGNSLYGAYESLVLRCQKMEDEVRKKREISLGLCNLEVYRIKRGYFIAKGKLVAIIDQSS